MSWVVQLAAAMYSASAVEVETTACFLLCQETKAFPRNWQPPDVDFLVVWQPAKSLSEYPESSMFPLAGYEIPSVGAPFRYPNILFTAIRLDFLGDVWDLAQ